METKRQVKSSVKDESLIEKRREQMIRGAVKLFKEKGFHRTTTREIAKEAGFSIGTLYEYIRTKEDVLYLVCDSIYNEVHNRLLSLPIEQGTIDGLQAAIKQYFHLIDDMSDEFLVMYQESKSLPKDALKYVLKKEMEMVALFEDILQTCAEIRRTAHSGRRYQFSRTSYRRPRTDVGIPQMDIAWKLYDRRFHQRTDGPAVQRDSGE